MSRLRRRSLLLGGASLALGAGGLWAWRRREVADASSLREARVAAALLESFPNPVSLSPDGQRLLTKTFLPSEFVLTVLDRRTAQVLVQHAAADTQLAPTWSASGDALAFFADRGGSGEYRLHMLDVATGKARRIEVPTTTTTALRWAPTDRRLAYLQTEPGESRRQLLVTSAEGIDTALADVAPKCGFDWAPDGARMATVERSDEGSIVIVRPSGGVLQRIAVVPGGSVHGIAWSPDGAVIVVSCNAKDEDWYGLAAIDLATSTVRRIASPRADLSGPLVLPESGGFVFHENVDGDVVVRVCDKAGQNVRTLGFQTGHSVVTGFSKDGAAARVLYTGRDAPPALHELRLDALSSQDTAAPPASTLVFAGKADARRPPIPVERLVARASDGASSPTYVWRSPRPSARRAALVRVHGGPNGQAMKSFQAPVDLLAREGFDILSVNYRGSSGYGLAFERMGTLAERASDVLAARDLAVDSLGVPPERVYLWGHSYGAELALAAARADRRGLGGVALISLTGRAAPGIVPRAVSYPIVAFHGAADHAASPEDAKASIAASFGSSNVAFTVFRDEGHSFTRIDTWVKVYSAVLAWLDAS